MIKLLTESQFSSKSMQSSENVNQLLKIYMKIDVLVTINLVHREHWSIEVNNMKNCNVKSQNTRKSVVLILKEVGLHCKYTSKSNKHISMNLHYRIKCGDWSQITRDFDVGERGANEAPGQKRPLLRFLLTAQGCKGVAGYCLCLVRATFSALTCSMKHGS